MNHGNNTLSYDARGRLLKVTKSTGEYRTYSYDVRQIQIDYFKNGTQMQRSKLVLNGHGKADTLYTASWNDGEADTTPAYTCYHYRPDGKLEYLESREHDGSLLYITGFWQSNGRLEAIHHEVRDANYDWHLAELRRFEYTRGLNSGIPNKNNINPETPGIDPYLNVYGIASDLLPVMISSAPGTGRPVRRTQEYELNSNGTIRRHLSFLENFRALKTIVDFHYD